MTDFAPIGPFQAGLIILLTDCLSYMLEGFLRGEIMLEGKKIIAIQTISNGDDKCGRKDGRREESTRALQAYTLMPGKRRRGVGQSTQPFLFLVPESRS